MIICAAQKAAAVREDLAQQRLAHGAQIDQVHRPAGGLGQVTDQCHLLAGAEHLRRLHGNVQVAVGPGRAACHRPEHEGQLQAAV